MKFSFLKIARVGMAATLVLWVAGAGCLLGCEGMMTAAASEGPARTAHTNSDLNPIEQPAPVVTQLRLPNRGHTYLRVCSFLI